MGFRTSVEVRFGDVDHAGIVYYPQFFIYFHEAFEDFFNDAGIGYPKLLDERRVGFPTVHVETDYKSPLRYGDRLDIELTVEKLSNRSMVMCYKGFRHRDGALSVTCHITTVCVDMNTFTSREIPTDLRELFERFKR
ncbi:MAG TPA: thioesterase family protein [Pseudomonadota bacterium]|jgi:4-hydroxybenzoyl-CoA thioesterase|nr:thioesterase family protein [Pseudomonadota bacterium]